MKNITKILFAGALAIPTLGTAQVNVNTTPENRNAVVEEWTGIYCQYCPTGHIAVQEAITNNPGDVVGINIHEGSYADPNGSDPDFRTADGDIMAAPFNISGYPSSTLNRRTISGAQTYHPAGSNDADKVPTIIAEMSEVNMHITATVNVMTRVLDVNVEYYYTANAPNGTNYLYAGMLQNNVEGPQTGGATYNAGAILPNGNYNHMHMFRGYLSGVWGDAISTTTMGATQIVSYQQTLPMDLIGVDLDISNLEIFAFINDGNQSAGDILTGVSIYATLTGFPASDEVIFESANLDDIYACDVGAQTVNPTANIRNWGSNVLTSATITYDVNGGTPVVMNWTGSIAPGVAEDVTLDPITFTPNAGSNTMNVSIAEPNGVADITTDNSGSSLFNASTTSTLSSDYTVTVNLTTDRYATETTWELTNSQGTVIASAGPWANLAANGTTVQPPVDANISANECYTFTIYDSYGDGIDSGYGVGSFSVEDQSGNVLTSGGNFTTNDFGLFKAISDASINEVIFEEVSIFPNPASEVLNVNFSTEATDFVVSILDLQGRVIASQTGSKNVTFPVADLASGSYLVTISTENGVHTENVVIK
ncbi:MAG: hypothetical protein ACJA0U_002111 [Salibacteraceae bacterium]|jgi:hypothetical protein